jgi:hypothetical protein
VFKGTKQNKSTSPPPNKIEFGKHINCFRMIAITDSQPDEKMILIGLYRRGRKNMVASDIGLEKTRIEIKDLARREVLA